MQIVVRKYGGSSLATPEQILAIAGSLAELYRSGYAPVAVVSARGDRTDELLAEAACFGTGPAREVDQLLATGECASAALLALALNQFGVPAASLTGPQAGILATGPHRAGRIAAVRPDRVERLVAEGVVPVVAGFQGLTEAGDVITLGRGGSDTTAVVLAAALRLDHCEIYSDVDGVCTADPRLVANTRLLRTVGAAAMSELAMAGARVLHSRAVEAALTHGVDIHIGHSAGTIGTVVQSRGETGGFLVGVAHDLDTVRVTCDSLQAIGAFNVPIDFLCHSTVDRFSFTVSAADVPRGWDGDDSLGKVSLVGYGLMNRVAEVARIHALLAGIPVLATALSELRASVLVPRQLVIDAVCVLHKGFGLDGVAS